MQTIDHSGFLSMSFPERLVQLRKTRRLTQQQLADLTGVHLTQIQRYEAAQTQPTLEVMKKLAVGLAVSADLLLFDEDERGPDDALKLQFEAVKQFDDDDRRTAIEVLEGLILKHQAKRMVLRAQSAPAPAARPAPKPAPTRSRSTRARASG